MIEVLLKNLDLNQNDALFAKRVFATDPLKYQQRLQRLGFSGKDLVIDLGAGFGQWSIELAKLNKKVIAIEACSKRCEFLKRAKTHFKISNLEIHNLSLPNIMQISDSLADGVFCYSTLMCTPWKESLDSIVRILKKDGLLYLNCNSFGWYKFLWLTEHNKNADYDPRKVVWQTYFNTWKYLNGEKVDFPTHLLITPDEMRHYLESLKFSKINLGPENSLGVEGINDIEPNEFLCGMYDNELAVYEVLAIK